MEIAQIMPSVYRFEDDTASTAYLVIGSEKALAIDTGTGHAPFLPLLKQYTDLPIELAVTHAHGDHYGAAHEFDAVYMHEKDVEILPQMQERFGAMMGVKPIREGTLRPVREGDVIELGGTSVLILHLGGHTPGSCVFADTANHLVFTGDAIGSGIGVWMQVPYAYPIAQYLESLRHFREIAAPYASYRFLGGHYTQEGAEGSDRYNPLSMAVVEDMIALCQRLLSGEQAYEDAPWPGFGDRPPQYAVYRSASIVFHQDRLL